MLTQINPSLEIRRTDDAGAKPSTQRPPASSPQDPILRSVIRDLAAVSEFRISEIKAEYARRIELVRLAAA